MVVDRGAVQPGRVDAADRAHVGPAAAIAPRRALTRAVPE
jgi:hypothetical protein